MSPRIIVMVAAVIGASACEPGADARGTSESVPVADTAPRPVPPDTTSPIVTPAVQLRAALEETLRGAGEHAGDYSWFSPATARALRSVSVDSSGYAIVDFEDLSRIIPNASSSAGSAILLDELNATVFSVDAVRAVEYRMEGSCERFWEWLQYGCHVVHRPTEGSVPS